MTWLQTHTRLAMFSVLVLSLALFVISLVVREERRLGGLEIVLESRPVDLRDPLRGDYVIFGYEAEELPGFSTPTFQVGNRAYLRFVHRGRYWEPITVRTGLPLGLSVPRGVHSFSHGSNRHHHCG
jgi:hypothetical protein